MGYIYYNLTNTGSLHTLASGGAGLAGTLPPGMPAAGGLYLILHLANNNRYIGKAGNLQDRFNGRMLTVNELGLSAADLANLGVFWGAVTAYNTPPGPVADIHTYFAPPPPATHGFRVIANGAGAGAAVPPALVGAVSGPPNYGAPVVNVAVDGQLVNVEALLIRFFMVGIGVGGTVTNGHYTGPFQNPCAHELIVMVDWGACAVVGVPPGHFCISIPSLGMI